MNLLKVSSWPYPGVPASAVNGSLLEADHQQSIANEYSVPLQTLESFRKQLLVSVSMTSMKRFLSTAYPLKAVNSSLESKTEMIQSISVFWELSDFVDPLYQALFHIFWDHHRQM